MRPLKVVNTGVPSATASRFIVPPALTTRSAKAIRLWASIARSGTIRLAAPQRPHRVALALGARDHHRLRLGGRAPGARSSPLVEVVAGVVLGGLGRRADDDEHLLAIEPELVEHAGSGSKPAR